MRKILVAIFLFFLQLPVTAWACEVCKTNQPEPLQGITHGVGPQGDIDYIIAWTAVVIVGITLFLSAKFLFKPGETDQLHIKNITIE